MRVLTPPGPGLPKNSAENCSRESRPVCRASESSLPARFVPLEEGRNRQPGLQATPKQIRSGKIQVQVKCRFK